MAARPDDDRSRRRFLAGVGGVGAAVGIGLGLGTVARGSLRHSAAEVEGDEGGADAWIEVEDTAIEDLMREHAVLERVLLVYEEGARRLETGAEVAAETLAGAAGIVRRYIEDHHERDEETHLFPRLERIGAELALIETLLRQHAAGRRLTSEVLALAAPGTLGDPSARTRLAGALRQFVRMYRPHAAQENTVLFPSFRKAVSRKEYETLRATLEKSERATFGEHLYEGILREVAELERAFGIGELAAFTPP
ncbi:MAG: hemerythrin domain-containing protein [Polyangiaceae bacterium]